MNMANVNFEKIDLTLAISKLHEQTLLDGDLGCEYWNAVIRLLKRADSLQLENERLQQKIRFLQK